MIKDKIIVTSYPNPDLDGVACAYAYAEFLRRQGNDAQPAVYLEPLAEVFYVFKRFGIKLLANIEDLPDYHQNIVLVDHSFKSKIFNLLKPENVVEIIDHHPYNESNFPNAKVQNEHVGAAATLVAEKFRSAKLRPSETSAVLLYTAIISNTINFKNNTTTDRDRDLAAWLKLNLDLPDNYINEFFKAKTDIDETIEKFILKDFVNNNFLGKKVGIGQVEIIDIKGFISDHEAELTYLLQSLENKYHFDLLFINFIDVMEGYNIIYAYDDKTVALLTKLLDINFSGKQAVTDHIIMRKEIFKKLSD